MILFREQEDFPNNTGQSLFEVVFAIAIAAIILTGVVSLATTSVRNVDTSKSQTLAVNEARSAVDWLRQQRDDDWANLADHIGGDGPVWCLDELSWLQSGNCGSTDYISGTNLIREVTLTSVDTNTIGATVEVSWTDAQGEHVETLSTQFTNWQTGMFVAPPALPHAEPVATNLDSTCSNYCSSLGLTCVVECPWGLRCQNPSTGNTISYSWSSTCSFNINAYCYNASFTVNGYCCCQ